MAWPKGTRRDIPPAVRWAICSKGGKRAWELGKAHRFTPEEARAAAMKSLVTRKFKRLLKADLG